jgi:glycosyltransferase involved in cell wall biosynthesis
MSVRVVIDGSALADASAFRGIGRYLRGVVDGLAARSDVEPVVLCKRKAELPAGVQRRNLHRYAPGRFAAAEHELLLPLDLYRIAGDVVHSPAQDPPRRCRRPWVQTLHGVVPLVDPDPRFEPERKSWARWTPRMRRANAVISVSAFCADQGIRLLGLDAGRVHVVHHGIDDRFRQQHGEPNTDPPYLLFVGEYGPSKGHDDAYAVIAAIAEHGLPHRLKVVGRIASWYREEIEAQVARSPRPDRIDLLGYVGDDLPGLYREATGLLISSRYESFCLPAVEAMASGTPVIAYGNTALPEILGGAGRLARDGDIDDLARRTIDVLTSRALSTELRESGYARSADFSWEKCAAQHAEVFTSLVA